MFLNNSLICNKFLANKVNKYVSYCTHYSGQNNLHCYTPLIQFELKIIYNHTLVIHLNQGLISNN